jgi:DNA-binding NtrC family response regulator
VIKWLDLKEHPEPDHGELVLCYNGGRAWETAWRPILATDACAKPVTHVAYLTLPYQREKRRCDASLDRVRDLGVMKEIQEKLGTLDDLVDQTERTYLEYLLRVTSGNIVQASRIAKRHRTDFYRLLQRHGLKAEAFRGEPQLQQGAAA